MKKANINLTDLQLIAPCGLDCRLCRAYLREKNACPGCRGDDSIKSNACVTCKIKNCPKIADGEVNFCSECDEFPCSLINKLEKRYTQNYELSVISNLKYIKKHGLKKFLDHENKGWACPKCGELLCMHKNKCPSCGYLWR